MGWAVSLDGIDDYIDLGALGDLGKNIGSAKINITFRTPKDYAPGNLTVLAGTVNDTTFGLNLAIRLNAERYSPNPLTYAPGKTNFYIRVRSGTTSRYIECHINNNVLYDGDYHTLIVDYTDINNSNLRVYIDGILQTIQHYALKDNIVTSPDNIQYGLAVGACNSRGVIEFNSQVDILSVKVILNDQPHAEYPIDEGQGNIIHDISGNDYHGTIHGATWGWVDDPINLNLDIVSDFRAKAHIGLNVETLPATDIGSKSMTLNGKLKGLGNYAGAECSFQYYPVDQYKNYALKFDGVDDRISFNKAIIPTDGGPWTISFMAKIDSLSTGQSSVISQYAPGSDNRFSIHANFDSGYWSMVQEPALGVVDIAPIVLGEVAYITVSYDGEKLKCYKNDICVTTVEISNLEILDLPTLIGNRNRTGYNDTFNGIIDELSVWSRALSKEEIEEHLHQELTGAEEGLIAYYRFNEGEGDILHDCSRNYNDGIIHGAQWVDSPFKLMPPKEKLEITEKFSDDFDRSTLGPDWEIAPGTQGSVQLQNGELVLTGDSSRRMWVRTARTFEARSIVFGARRDSADAESDIGLAFNWDGSLASSGVGKLLNGYRLSWTVWENPSKLKITRYDNGVDTDLASTEFPPDYNEHEFAILIEDGVIRVFVDGVQMLQANDSTYTSGYIGLTAREGGNRRGRYNWIVVKGTKEEKVLMPTPLRETPSQKIYSPYTLVKTVTPKEVKSTQDDFQQGTLDGVVATAAGDLALEATSRDDFIQDTRSKMTAVTLDAPSGGITAASEGVANGVLTISATGSASVSSDLWDTNHHARILYAQRTGDFVVSTHVSGFSGATYQWNKMGIIVFDALPPNATRAYATMCVTPGNGFAFQYDNNGDGKLETSVAQTGTKLTSGYVRLRRVGNTIYGDYSTDGINWTNQGSFTFANSPASVYVGLFVTPNSQLVRGGTVTAAFEYVDGLYELYLQSGTRTSPILDLSSVGTAAGSSIAWDAITPAGTSVTVETRLSLDGGQTWGAWQVCTNGRAIPSITPGMDLSNARLQTRQTLSTTDTTVTPVLTSLTVNVVTPYAANGSRTAEVNGLYFDGVNDYVSIPHNAIIKPQRITIMAWVDRDDWSKVGTNDARIISCIESGGYGISCHSDGRISFALYIDGEYRYAYSSGPISLGLHFICATYDGKSLKLYIDGELDSEIPYSGNISYSVNNHVTIGAEPTGVAGVESGSYLSGVIRNLSIWNRGLSKEEVSYYYNNELKGNEHGLVAYYKMDEGEGNKIYNSSLYKDEYNLDGTISGATWDIASLPKTKYKYEPGVKFSYIITPGEYKLAPSKGLSFDGVDDYVVNNSFVSPFTGKKEVSVIARVKLQPKSSTAHRILILNNCFTFGVNYNGDLGGYVYDSSWKGEWSWDSSATVPMSEEVTLAFTYDGSLLKGYINGILSAQHSATISGFGGSSLLEIGMSPSNITNPHPLKGEISNLSIWSRVLGQEEILFYQDKQLNGNETGLVSYYKEPFRNKLLLDVANNKNDGLIYGAQEVNCSPLYSLDIEPSGTRYYYRAVAKGLPDYALGFNGTSSYSEIGGHETTSPLAINEEYTCIVKFKTNVIRSSEQPILSQNNNSGDYNFHSRGLAIRENQLSFWSRDSSRVWYEITYPISPNTWYCATLVQDRNVIKGFLDGVSIGQLNMGSFMTGYESYHAIGTWTADKTTFFDGSIKEIQIYNRALSEEEIKQYQEIQLVGNEPGLVAYYRIVEGEGDILVDHTMNQNHGTIYGATWEQL